MRRNDRVRGLARKIKPALVSEVWGIWRQKSTYAPGHWIGKHSDHQTTTLPKGGVLCYFSRDECAAACHARRNADTHGEHQYIPRRIIPVGH